MKRIFFKIVLTLILSIPQISLAEANGLFFNVSLQNNVLSITTTIPNKIYPAAGIKFNTPGFTLANPGVDCTPTGNGYCLFPVSNTIQRNIAINGPSQSFSIRLCLNGRGPLSCQDYILQACDKAGGKIVAGSNACWIIMQADPSGQPRCSSVCNAVGLTLQNPGPTNNATLAGNVCSAFGFTSPPLMAGQDLTFIGHADNIIPFDTSCIWRDFTGTNWDNPGNEDFASSGFYICPCASP